MTTTYFPVPRRAGACAECSVDILNLAGRTTEEEDLGYRRVHFDLSDDTEAFISFCPECAGKPWTDSRLSALEHQCKAGWAQMQTPGMKPSWTGDHLTFRPSPRPMQTWAEVQ